METNKITNTNTTNLLDMTKTGPLSYRELLLLSSNSDVSTYYLSGPSGSRAALQGVGKVNYDNNPAFTNFGSSRYDSKLVNYDELSQYNELRGERQPWYAKLGAGIAKMGVLAGTTFLDGIVGSIAGLINLGGDLFDNKISSGNDALWSFIDNPFSKLMLKINEKAEELLPNYYTYNEQNSPWYTNIFTANFIGDKFLKNLGFTIGAAGTALVSAGFGSKALINKGIRDAFKGVVVNSAGKTLRTGKEIYQAYRTGDAIMDGVKLTKDLGKAAKLMKNAEMKLKLIGSVTSAAGEGRIEAITNANQWELNMVGHLEELHRNFLANLELEMYNKHPEYFTQDAEGNFIIADPRGIQEFNRRALAEQKNYENARADISKKKAAIGNSIFGLNLALLSGSNLFQFGRFMSGGYTAGRTARNLVTGSIGKGFAPNKAIARMKRFRALSNPLMEALEEMSQSGISEGSGLWGSSHINDLFGSFYGGKIDPDAEALAQSWLGGIVSGFANAYGSIDRWEEGFIGGLTGLLGIPKIKMKTKENGKKGLSFSMDGELWQGLREAKSLNKEANEIAQALNERVQSPDFLNYYQGMIRHNGYQATMDGALDSGDAFEFKNAEHSLMVSDAIMFDKAGRLQDLYDMIEEGANTSLEDVKTLRELSVDKQSGKSIYEGMTDELVVKSVKKQALSMKDTVDRYVKTSTDLKTLYGENISSDVLEELTWGMTQVDNWELRLGLMSSDIKTTLQDKAQVLQDRFGINLEVTLNNLQDFGNHFNADRNLISEINDIIEDKNLTVQEGRDKIEKAIKTRQLKTKDNNLKLGRKVLNLRRKFKASTDRLEKQREKALNQMGRAEARQGELRDLMEQELLDYEASMMEILSEQYEAIDRLQKELSNGREKGREQDLAPYNRAKEAIKLVFEGKADIYQSFDRVLREVDQELAWAEAAFNTDRVLDQRFKRGYDPNSRPVAIGNESVNTGQIVSEAEAEERHRVREKNYNLLFEIMDLKDALNNPNNQLVSPIDTELLTEKLLDMAKIVAVRTKFIDTYQQLSENPELFQEKILEQMRAAIAAHVDKQVNAGLDAINTATTVGELREALSNIEEPSLISQILERAKEGESEDLKLLVQEYENLEEMRSLIFGTGKENQGIIGAIQASEEEAKKYALALQTIQDALDTSESLDEAKQTLGLAILDAQSSDPELALALENILDRYDELSKSSRRSKKDKKPKKKVKKKSRDEEDFDTEGTNKEEAPTRKPKKKKTAFEMLNEEDDDIFFEDEEDDIDDSESEDEETPDEPKSDDVDVVKNLKDMSVDDLDKVIQGDMSALGAVEAEDIPAIKELAEKIKAYKQAPSVHTESTGTNSELRQLPSNQKPSLRSWLVTGYQIDPLKGKLRQAVIFDHPTANALRALGAFDYVDSGRLGRLLRDNPDLPIHYITAPSKSGLENAVLLAIEVTNDVKALGTINPVKGSDGKMYLIVGSLGHNNSAAARQNYTDIVEDLTSERGDSTDDFFVSLKYLNKVSHIYSGRMVKSTETKDVKDRSIKEILNGEKPHFGIYYSPTSFRTPTLEGEEVVPLNINNANPREGSVWLMTREADGRWYAKAIRIKRFNEAEYGLSENSDTPIMLRIKDDLAILADPSKSDYERSIAKFDLETMLYFPKDAQFYFTGDIVSLKDEYGTNVANNIGEGMNAKEKAEEMLKALQGLNLRFQVATSELTSESYVEDLLDSNILISDLAMLHNVNASFDMPLLDPKTGKPLEDVKEEDTKGHTGKKGVNSSMASTTIMLGTERYSLYENGAVYKGEDRVTGQDIIDEVLFRDKIAQGTVLAIEGDDSLYIGHYSNGTEFGISRGRLKTGEELNNLKEAAKKRAKKQKQEEAKKKVEDSRKKREDDTVGGSPVALAYLLENSVGTILNAGYFLHGVSAAFPAITRQLEDLRAILSDDELGMAPLDFAKGDSPIILQMRELIEKTYGEEGKELFDILLENASGFNYKQGKQIDNRLEKLQPIEDSDDFLDDTEEFNPFESDVEFEDESDESELEDEEDDFFGDAEEFNPFESETPSLKPNQKLTSVDSFSFDIGGESDTLEDFNSLLISNRVTVRESGLTLNEVKKKARELGIDISTITTQEQFEGLLTLIKCKG